jgi:transcriptional regulator with XRE-family HTH domain
MELKKEQKSIQDDPFRWALKKEYKDLCEKNPNYSLRAFAKKLGISPSALSALINRKRRFTDKMKVRLGLRLDLPTSVIEKYVSQDPNTRYGDIAFSHAEYSPFDLDRFAIISDWYHMAILELVNIDGFHLSGQNIAKALGIPVTEANSAIERLRDQGLLFQKNGKWKSRPNTTMPLKGSAAEAIRKFVRQSLKKSIDALDTIDVKNRDHTTITIATDACQMEQAKSLITKFRRDMAQLLESAPQKSQVYQLQVSLFPISHTIKGVSDEDH